MDIAKDHSIDIDKYEIRNVIVKIKQMSLYFVNAFILIVGLIFIITSTTSKKSNIEFWLSIGFGMFFLLCSMFIFYLLFIFRLEFKDNKIIYRSLFGKKIIKIKDIKYYKIEKFRSCYTIYIYYLNKKYMYQIENYNKENLILLLNLQKLGIKQIDN